jgi:hypothetical protein
VEEKEETRIIRARMTPQALKHGINLDRHIPTHDL